MNNMQILGLDIGFSRTGFAIGNTITGLAFPREIVQYEEYLQKILWYIEESGEGIEKIVIGVPNNMSHSENVGRMQCGSIENSGKNDDHMQKILAEISRITQLVENSKKPEISVETFDEQFTSKIAEQSLYTMGYSAKKQKGKKDNMAAAIILQGYLDRSANMR